MKGFLPGNQRGSGGGVEGKLLWLLFCAQGESSVPHLQYVPQLSRYCETRHR